MYPTCACGKIYFAPGHTECYQCRRKKVSQPIDINSIWKQIRQAKETKPKAVPEVSTEPSQKEYRPSDEHIHKALAWIAQNGMMSFITDQGREFAILRYPDDSEKGYSEEICFYN